VKGNSLCQGGHKEQQSTISLEQRQEKEKLPRPAGAASGCSSIGRGMISEVVGMVFSHTVEGGRNLKICHTEQIALVNCDIGCWLNVNDYFSELDTLSEIFENVTGVLLTQSCFKAARKGGSWPL
jgi:hypothetical protein